jgi:hypothetical protein
VSELKIVALGEHRDRVKQLRKQGYRVKVLKLPNGARLVLKSRKAFVCRANHCTWKREAPKKATKRAPKKKTRRKANR